MKNFDIYTKNDVDIIAFSGNFTEIVAYVNYLDNVSMIGYTISHKGNKYTLEIAFRDIPSQALDKLLVLSHVEDYKALDYVERFKVLNWFVPYRSCDFMDIQTKTDLIHNLNEHFYIHEKAYMINNIFGDNILLGLYTDMTTHLNEKLQARQDYKKWLDYSPLFNPKPLGELSSEEINIAIRNRFTRKFALSNWDLQTLTRLLPKLSYKQRIELYTNYNNYNTFMNALENLRKEIKNRYDTMKMENIHHVNPWTGKSRVMLCNLNTILSKYYDKEITLNFDKNAPKINKQLKKLGIKPTQKELVAIGEFSQWLTSFDFTESLYIDLDDFELPTKSQIDRWAFRGSCHHQGGVGGNTADALREVGGYYYIRIYDANKHARARAYYKHVGFDIAHAGMYSDFADSKINHTAYDATTLILAALWGRKVDEFKNIEGNKLPEQDGIWCNMSELNDYRTMGTDEILFEDTYQDYDFDEDMVYSEVMEQYLDRDEAVYCENIDDYVDESNCVYSEWHDQYFATGFGNEPIYSSQLNDYFETENDVLECALD